MKLYFIKSQEQLRKELLNQLIAFESCFNKRKEKIGVKPSKKIKKYLNKIKGILK